MILLQSFFGFSLGGGAEVDIILDDADTRKMAEIKDENGRKERFYLFYDGESVSGKVSLIRHKNTLKQSNSSNAKLQC